MSKLALGLGLLFVVLLVVAALFLTGHMLPINDVSVVVPTPVKETVDQCVARLVKSGLQLSIARGQCVH